MGLWENEVRTHIATPLRKAGFERSVLAFERTRPGVKQLIQLCPAKGTLDARLPAEFYLQVGWSLDDLGHFTAKPETDWSGAPHHRPKPTHFNIPVERLVKGGQTHWRLVSNQDAPRFFAKIGTLMLQLAERLDLMDSAAAMEKHLAADLLAPYRPAPCEADMRPFAVGQEVEINGRRVHILRVERGNEGVVRLELEPDHGRPFWDDAMNAHLVGGWTATHSAALRDDVQAIGGREQCGRSHNRSTARRDKTASDLVSGWINSPACRSCRWFGERL